MAPLGGWLLACVDAADRQGHTHGTLRPGQRYSMSINQSMQCRANSSSTGPTNQPTNDDDHYDEHFIASTHASTPFLNILASIHPSVGCASILGRRYVHFEHSLTHSPGRSVGVMNGYDGLDSRHRTRRFCARCVFGFLESINHWAKCHHLAVVFIFIFFLAGPRQT